MRSRKLGAALLVLVALCVVACADTPSKRWAQGREFLTDTTNLTLTAYQAGVIDQDDYRTIYPGLRLSRSLLDQAEGYLPDGGVTFDDLLGSARTELVNVRAYIEATEREDGQ